MNHFLSYVVMYMICISGWKDVTLNKVIDVDIEQGLEIKVVYDRRINPNEEFKLKFSSTHFLTISLGDRKCSFHGCPIRKLNLDTVQNGIAFILNIHRKDAKLLIGLNGKKNVQIDMNTLARTYWACVNFWGEGISYKVQFTAVSKNLITQYRMVTTDEGVNGGGGDDDNIIAGKFYIGT